MIKTIRETGFFRMAVLAVSLLFLVPAAGYGADTGNLMGFVYASDAKTPVEDAQVVLENIDDPKVIFESNVTEEKGDYRILNVPAGTYKVFIRLKNKPYKIRRIDFLILIVPDQSSFVSFVLKKGKIPLAIILPGTAGAVGSALLIGSLIREDVASTPLR